MGSRQDGPGRRFVTRCGRGVRRVGDSVELVEVAITVVRIVVLPFRLLARVVSWLS